MKNLVAVCGTLFLCVGCLTSKPAVDVSAIETKAQNVCVAVVKERPRVTELAKQLTVDVLELSNALCRVGVIASQSLIDAAGIDKVLP